MLLKNAITALAGFWVLSVHAAPNQPVNLRTLLSKEANSWAKGTILSFPNSPTFSNATERWSTFDAPTYFAAVSPANEADVVKSIPFLATGARHGYSTTLGNEQQGLAIDLGQFKTYSIDSTVGTVTVGGATTIGDFQHALYDAGYMIQSGSGSCPGFVGLTVGSGVGRYTGLFGLVCDALLSARVVTADGQLLQVSEKQNPDLFWGIRGAGANLGIITSATYQAHKLVNQGQIMTADFIFPANMSRQYFDVLGSFSGKMPPELAVITIIYYDTTAQATQIVANWAYIGPKEKGLQVIAPVTALKPPSANIQVVPWSDLIATAGGGFDAGLCQKNLSRSFYSANLRNLSASTYQATFDKMAKFYETYPDARRTSIDLETFPNQAMAAVSNDATAYPWRDALGYIQISVITASGNAAGDPAAMAGTQLGSELRDSWASTSGYPELSVYINYARGDEQLPQRYGADKLPRLAGLKRKWDPDNVFAYNNALPTTYPG
ncbi:MAG: hypothetical protein Q9175_007076 [Cornicularia normoerica]